MSDAYLNFANSAFGARLAGMLGLPRPVPLERFEAGQPVVAGDVLVGAGGTPELLPALLAAFRAMRAATVAHRSVQGWTAMANQAGLMSGLPGSWGDGLEEIHEVLANTTLALIVLHVAGVIFSSLSHRENLIGAMITGFKQREKP